MAQPKGIPKERNIIRIDGKRSHGWQVKFSFQEREISKFFSDGKYGSVEKALDEARNFRDSFLVDWQAVKTTQGVTKHPSDVGKVMGVFFVKGKKKANSHEYSSHWRAQWNTPEGERKFANFFVATHGYEEAHNLAVQARLAGTGETLQAIQPRASFVIPANPNIKLWRYLDFTKFISMLEKSSLFFVFMSFLNDPFEGSISAINNGLRPSLFEKKLFEKKIDREQLRSRVAVSSWHMNTQESAAMWKLYAQTNEAVCVQSTYSLLRKTLPPVFRISEMNYVDYNSDYIPEYHPLAPFVFKRKSFEHEHELRALIDLKEADSTLHEFLGVEVSQYGIYKTADLTGLIQKVYVAPESPDWFYDLVQSVCKTYKMSNIPVVRSSLETEPFY